MIKTKKLDYITRNQFKKDYPRMYMNELIKKYKWNKDRIRYLAFRLNLKKNKEIRYRSACTKISEYIIKKCPCGKEIRVTVIKSKRKKYCSKKCFYKYHKRSSGLKYNIKIENPSWWKKKQIPWNKNKHGVQKNIVPHFKKGIHYSSETEFKYKNGNGYRHLLKRGTLKQSCVECDESNLKRLHVHHIDSDRSNNRIENLLVICRKHHLPMHGRIERHYVEGRKIV